ncbi:hypothetical protein ACQJBY_043184 [Aegilops geniculata]
MEIMGVQVRRTFVVPPAAAPSEEVPLTVFDLAAPTYHVTVLFAFSPPNPTNQALLDALSATLPRFPLLTAAMRLDRRPGTRPCFVTGKGGAGALVVEAEVPSSALSDHLPLAPSPGHALLHPAVRRGAAPHVLMLQINRFACGGIVIASSSHHQVADGHSMTMFFHAWADAVRGDGLHVDCAPVPYGPAALVPRRPPRCEFEHRGAEFLPLSPAPTNDDGRAIKPPAEVVHHVDTSEITNMLLHYTSEFVAELKCAAHNRYTTFETVSAQVWRRITAARGLDDGGDAHTSIRIAVNGRGRLAGTGALPAAGFFGNVVLTAISGTRAAALATGTVADAAALVRAGIRVVDGGYFQSFVDFGALHGDEDLEPACKDEAGVLSLDVEADSWLHLDLHRLDFGCGGRLVGILPGKVPQDGVVVLMPSLRKGGGIDVFVALWEKHARELSAIAYA